MSKNIVAVNKIDLTEKQRAAVEFAIYDTIRRLRMESVHSKSFHTEADCLATLEEIKEFFC